MDYRESDSRLDYWLDERGYMPQEDYKRGTVRDYNLPAVSDQFLNKRIKIILKELAEVVPSLKRKVPVLVKRNKGGTLPDDSTIEKDKYGNAVKSRYECITSHTARRTGITRL